MIEETDKDHSGAIDFRLLDLFMRNLNFVFREFCGLMVRRDQERETVEDLKQAFRVFDKEYFSYYIISSLILNVRMGMATCQHQNSSLL